jgi:uncharacterized membrane protein required for colicin V production
MLAIVNWLDYVILAYMALGAWLGLRMGLLATIASLVAYGAGLVTAARFGDPLLAAANARWDLAGRFGHWLGTARAPVPVLLPLYRSQLGVGGGPVSPAAVDAAAAGLILHYAAFAVVFIVAHAIVWAILAAFLVHAPHRGPAGLLNAVLGLCAGAAERAVVAAVLLGLLASMGAIAALAPLSQAIAGSRLSPWLLAAFRAWQPAAAHWWASVG